MTTETKTPEAPPVTSAPAFGREMEPMPSFTEVDAKRFRKARIRGWRDRGLLIALGLAFLMPALGALGMPWAYVGRAVLLFMSIALMLWCAGLFFVHDWKNEGRSMALFAGYNIAAIAVFFGTLAAEEYLAQWFGNWVLVLAPLPLIFELVVLHLLERSGKLEPAPGDGTIRHDYIGD